MKGTDTARLAKYGLDEVIAEPTNNDDDPTAPAPDDAGDPLGIYDDEPHAGPFGGHWCHPDMVGVVCSTGFVHTDEPPARAPAEPIFFARIPVPAPPWPIPIDMEGPDA